MTAGDLASCTIVGGDRPPLQFGIADQAKLPGPLSKSFMGDLSLWGEMTGINEAIK